MLDSCSFVTSSLAMPETCTVEHLVQFNLSNVVYIYTCKSLQHKKNRENVKGTKMQ